MTTPFAQLSQRTQTARLRPLAHHFAREFDLNPAALKLVHYGYNATYKLTDKSGKIYSLKLILDTPRTESHLRAEIEWCHHLAKNSIPVARPISNHLPQAELEGFPKPVYALCNKWIYGRKLPENPNPNDLFLISKLTRSIYECPPPTNPNSFPDYRTTLGESPLVISDPTLLECIKECDETLKQLWNTQPATALHFDLHNWNVLKHNRILQAFDFEYAHIAPPLLEVANLIFYFTFKKPTFDARQVIWSAFNFSFSDFGLTPRQFESLIVMRKVLFCNDLFITNNPKLIEIQQRNHDRTKLLVDHFNKTDQYDPSILP